MNFLSQADFARLHNVSRKTVTTWKKRGYIEISDGLVDVERSNTKLAGVGRAWPQVVTGAPNFAISVTRHKKKWPAVVTAADNYDWSVKNGCSVGVEPAASKLAILADYAVIDAAPLILRHLSPGASLVLLDELLAMQRENAIGLLEDKYSPPAGYVEWGHHVLFQGPAVSAAEWDEMLADAVEWRKAQAGADA